MRSRLRTRRWLVLAAVVVLALAAGAAVFLSSSQPGDVSNPEVEFTAPRPSTVPDPPRRADTGFDWPFYGYTKARTRYLPLAQPLRPPFTERWKLPGSVLLEFPPVIHGQSLYLLKNNGALYGLSRRTGKVQFKRKLGDLAASSPAYDNGTIYVVLLGRGNGIKAGRVVAVSAQDGRTRWSKPLPSRAESSPLVDNGTLYFGSEDGTVYAMRASDGFVRWRAKAAGAVKGGLALAAGKLFFGDYSGRVTALRASDGHIVWSKGTSGGTFGLTSGTFYATPAVAFGRVYIGNTDGFVYSYATSDGALAWRTRTGGYVYGSAAVAQVAGLGPTVYVGSYDGTFYALDARTGGVRWERKAEGRISGGSVLLGDLVFYSTLERTTTALGASTGRTVWSTHQGAFNPVVSDGRDLYLVGYTSLFGLTGRRPAAQLAPNAPTLQRNARAQVAKRDLAQRRAAVRRHNDLIRRGVRYCVKQGGRTVCRPLAPLVCVKGSGGQTTCRPRARKP
jgi:outer membrane protein assembly factor BamB